MSEAGPTGAAPGAAEGGTGQAAAPSADGQPFEGQGLYDLADVPEELHQYLIPELKKIEGNVGRKLQEAADLRKQVEPLQGVEGLSDIPAEDLGALVDFYGIAQDPERFNEWFTQTAMQSAQEDPEAFEEWWADIGTELGLLEDGEGEGEGEGGEEPDAVAELRDQLAELQSQVGEFKQSETQREHDQRVQAREQSIQEQLANLDFGDLEGDELEEAQKDVIKLALAYDDREPDEQIQLAFQDYQRLIGRGESGLIDSKLNQPGGALNGGQATRETPEVTAENVKDFARERFRNGVGAGT
jgi:hypothetical protein